MKWSGQAVAAVAAVLMSMTAAGCASSRPGRPEPAGFAGYKWAVTSITHGAKPTPIPGRYDVYLAFAPNGEYVGNEAVNTHSGTYHQVGDGFTISDPAVSEVGYIGRNRAVLLSISAFSAFDGGAHVRATVSGDQLTVSVGGYRLDGRLDGRQPDFPLAPPA